MALSFSDIAAPYIMQLKCRLAYYNDQEIVQYEVSLSIDPFSEEDWNYVVETMAAEAIYSAELLAGEMPQNIEKVFTSNGLSLFPFTLSDIHSRCSCPDPQNPCKHIGAVYYQLGDRFSEDPFVLFQLRGRTKAQILDELRQLRSTGAGTQRNIDRGNSSVVALQEDSQPASQTTISSPVSSPLTHEETGTQTPLTFEQFWQYSEPLERRFSRSC